MKSYLKFFSILILALAMVSCRRLKRFRNPEINPADENSPEQFNIWKWIAKRQIIYHNVLWTMAEHIFNKEGLLDKGGKSEDKVHPDKLSKLMVKLTENYPSHKLPTSYHNAYHAADGKFKLK